MNTAAEEIFRNNWIAHNKKEKDEEMQLSLSEDEMELVYNSMEEYANQEKQIGAIAFRNWIIESRYFYDFEKKIHIAAWDGYSEYTTEQLYNLFLQANQK